MVNNFQNINIISDFCKSTNNLFFNFKFLRTYLLFLFVQYKFKNSKQFIPQKIPSISSKLKNQFQMTEIIDHSKQTKKPLSILKRKNVKISLCPAFSYLFKHDICPTLSRHAQQQDYDILKSFIKDIFCQKSIKSITRNDYYISLKLKQTGTKRTLLSEYAERFSRSNEKKLQNFSIYLRGLSQEFKQLYQKVSRTNLNNRQNSLQKQLQNFVLSKKGKKYVCFYYEPSNRFLSLDKIIISVQLLQQLGYDVKQFCDDFLKYKHLFFEIFDTSLFNQIIAKISQSIEELENCFFQFKGDENKEKQFQEQKKIQFKFNDYVFRNKRGQGSTLQQKVQAIFSFEKKTANISLLEIENLDQKNVIASKVKEISQQQQQLRKQSQKLVQQELECLAKLMYKNFLIQSPGNEQKLLLSVQN